MNLVPATNLLSGADGHRGELPPRLAITKKARTTEAANRTIASNPPSQPSDIIHCIQLRLMLLMTSLLVVKDHAGEYPGCRTCRAGPASVGREDREVPIPPPQRQAVRLLGQS